MAAVAGRSNYEISIIDKTENRSLTSFAFEIMQSKSSFDIGHVISSDEFGLLISKINEVDKLGDELSVLVDETQQVIDKGEEVISNCEDKTQDAISATEELQALHNTVIEAENLRIINEEERQTNTAIAIENAEKATQDAINQFDAMVQLESSIESAEEARVKAENLRQENTNTAIENAEKATQDAIEAKENADIATEAATTIVKEAQIRLDEYDSLNLLEITQNAVNATNNANIATDNANAATLAAEKATEEAIKAIKNIQGSIGIDDNQESSTSTWSSLHTHEVIAEDIANAIEESKKIFQRYRISDVLIGKNAWINHMIYIKSENIKSDSVIDIYYNNNHFSYIEDFEITYSQGNGWICLTCTYEPYNDILIDAIMIENYTNPDVAIISSSL